MTPNEKCLHVQETVRKTVTRFCQTYGERDSEEMLSQANSHAWEAVRTHDPNKGTGLQERVAFLVRNGLIDSKRKASRKIRSRINAISLPDGDLIPCTVAFCLSHFVKELSQDAAYVVRLVLLSEYPFTQSRRENRKVVVRMMKRQGWDKVRINKTITEIQEALP